VVACDWYSRKLTRFGLLRSLLGLFGSKIVLVFALAHYRKATYLLKKLFMTKVYGFALGFLWKFFPKGTQISQMELLNKIFAPEIPRNSFTSLLVRSTSVSDESVDQFASQLDSVAIVIQGKIEISDSFAVNSLYEYLRLFPKATLILSTWVDVSAALVSKLRKDGIHVILNEYPESFGFSNFNLQMKSTREGLLLAREMGFSTVVKVRTDQRISSVHALDYMYKYLSRNPLESTSGPQKKRMGFISLDSFAYRIYGLSDMLHFGHVDDLLTYWSGDEDPRNANELNFTGSLRDYSVSRFGEVRLFANFLEATSWDLKWTLHDYWRAVAQRCIVIDSSSIDLIWLKYSLFEYKWIEQMDMKYTMITNSFWARMGDSSVIPNETIVDSH
jgi:hypothetical protein